MNARDLIFGLAHYGINVPDLDEAVAFYRDLFGFQVTQVNYDENGEKHIVFIAKYDVVIELVHLDKDVEKAVDAAKATPNHLALACSDTPAFMRSLKEKGIACETEKDIYVERFGRDDLDINVVFLHGPGGERIEVFQQITK